MKTVRRGKEPALRTYQSGDWLTFNEAATLLAQRDQRSGEDLRQGIDRWRKRIRNHARSRKLACENEQFKIEILITWACQLKGCGAGWLAKLSNLPRLHLRECVEEDMAANDEELPLLLSSCLEECHEVIRRLYHENRRLLQENDQSREPAAKYKALCENHRLAASKRWKPK